MPNTLHELSEILASNSTTPDESPVLWQYLQKAAVAPDASDAEWYEFVRLYEGNFADSVSELAHRYWAGRDQDYIAENIALDADDDPPPPA